MLDKIIDKYLIRKIVKKLIDNSFRLVDFYCEEDKEGITIYVNHLNKKDRYEIYRKVVSINKESIIRYLSDAKEYQKMFNERIDEVLK